MKSVIGWPLLLVLVLTLGGGWPVFPIAGATSRRAYALSISPGPLAAHWCYSAYRISTAIGTGGLRRL